MGWSDETENSFPPQRHKEPLGLRQDILDELHDHLAEAAQREVDLGVEQEERVRENVLAKFGNPATVARALWWDAMKGTIMKDWIQIAVNTILCIGVIAFMTLFYRQMQATNTALLTALGDLRTPVETKVQLPSLTYQVRRGNETGNPATNVNVSLFGKAINDHEVNIQYQTDKDGRVTFREIQPGKYHLLLRDAVTGLDFSEDIVLLPTDLDKTVQLVAPPADPKPVNTQDPLGLYRSEPIAVIADMEVRWSQNKEYPYWRWNYKVMILPDGIYELPMGWDRESFKHGKRIESLHGTTVKFDRVDLVWPTENRSGEIWYTDQRVIGGRKSLPEFQYQISMRDDDEPTMVNFEIPERYVLENDFNRRYYFNQRVDIPDQYKWFIQDITERFPGYIVDSASLIKSSALLVRYRNQTVLRELISESLDVRRMISFDSDSEITLEEIWDKAFSFGELPDTLPEGHRILFAQHLSRTTIKDFEPHLEARLMHEASALPMIASHVYDTFDVGLGDVFWTANSEDIASNDNEPLFFDFTDAYRDNRGFDGVPGFLFRWSSASKNKISFSVPEVASEEHIPLWIVLKPSNTKTFHFFGE